MQKNDAMQKNKRNENALGRKGINGIIKGEITEGEKETFFDVSASLSCAAVCEAEQCC